MRFSKKNINKDKNFSNKNFKKKLDKKSFGFKKDLKSEKKVLSFNNVFLQRYEKFFGKDFVNQILSCKNNLLNQKFIRVNLSKSSNSKIEEFFLENRVKFSKTFLEHGFKINKSFFNLTSSLEFLGSKFYFQELASQIPVNCVDFDYFAKMNKKIRILDMASSPGSKTTQICDLFEFYKIDYELIAIEPNKSRLKKLFNNLQKLECLNVKVFNCYGQDFDFDEKFDLIFLDAPCSGNLARDKSWLKRRDLRGVLENSNVQKQLLKKANLLLDSKGILVYSTCSLEPEENEENVKFILKNSNLKVIKTNLKFDFKTNFLNLNFALRFMPNISLTQGFFVCLFKKK